MNTFLEPFSNRKVPGLYCISAVRGRRSLAHEQQIGHFVIDKVVITLNVRFIDIYAGSNPKQVLLW